MCVSSRFQATVASPPVNHRCRAHSDHLLPFPPASASQTWTQEVAAHLCAPRALVTGLRLGPGLERGCAGPDGSPPPAGREPSPPARTPPFHPGLRTKPSLQSVSHKQKGLAGRAQVRRHRRPTRKSVRSRLSPLSLPGTVLWGRPNTTISLRVL